MSTKVALYRNVAILGLTCALASAPAGVAAGAESVKLSGCLVKAEGDGNPYLLTNAPEQPAIVSSSGGSAPSSVGTTGEYRTVFYWLTGNDDLRQHVGHRVEIEGDLSGSVKPGEIKLDRKDAWTEMSVKSDGRSLKARIPNLSVVPGKNDDKEAPVSVRRVDVEHIKMLAASCDPNGGR
jgi:hypothetical protein